MGKSTAGVILAKVLGYEFVDADLVIQKEEGKLLKEIIEEVGTDGFIAVENRVNSSLEVDHSIIATGGSVVYGKEAMEHLKSIGTVVYLQLPFEELNRMKWEDDFRTYLKKLEETKPVIVTGDMNVAHKEIDLKNPKTNRKNAGFTDEERQKFTELLDAGFIDTFRYFYPEQTGIYSWWSYRFSARAKNAGWRIDYFCVSESLKDRLDDAKILTDIMGSDHCPVELDLK